MNELLEVWLEDDVSEKIVIETLQRIGIINRKEKILYPSCYLYKKDDRYFLAHFKQLFLLEGNGYNNISQEDIKRLNSIAYCLFSWELIDVDLKKIEPYDTKVFVLPHKEKKDWKISHKYKIHY